MSTSYIQLTMILEQGRSQTPASLGTSLSSTSTFFAAGTTITRNSRFSCGFCQGFRFPGKCNTFVGNCFLRILGYAEKVYPHEMCNYPLE